MMMIRMSQSSTHAGMCQYLSSTGLMLAASAQYWPSAGTFNAAYLQGLKHYIQK